MTPEPSIGGLVAVHAHPDDETLATGALLATWAAAGGEVTVVTCTRGEQGEVIGDDLAHLAGDGAALAEHRSAELAGALAALGAHRHAFLDQLSPAGPSVPTVTYCDSGMAWAGPGRAELGADVPDGAFVAVDVDEAALRLAGLLRELRPAVVVTYDPGGGYGHPDHVHAHRVTMRAVELAGAPVGTGENGDDGAPPVDRPLVLWAALDAVAARAASGLLADAVRSTGHLGLTAPDPEGPLPAAAVDPSEVAVVVDVLPVLPAVLAALASHRSQVQAVRTHGTIDPPSAVDRGAPTGPPTTRLPFALSYALSNDVLQPFPTVEVYRVAGSGDPRTVRWPAGVRVA